MIISSSLLIMNIRVKNCGGICASMTIFLVRLEQCRDSLVVVFPETERKVHMNTLEILTLLLVVFAAMTYTETAFFGRYFYRLPK